mmetsp:Transcript_48871/g.148678  ORF Transcript_48871/g.148678 Transcript_48871/m.148678 type:complete len:295 (-) Transcript_48871:54-938(-)
MSGVASPCATTKLRSWFALRVFAADIRARLANRWALTAVRNLERNCACFCSDTSRVSFVCFATPWRVSISIDCLLRWKSAISVKTVSAAPLDRSKSQFAWNSAAFRSDSLAIRSKCSKRAFKSSVNLWVSSKSAARPSPVVPSPVAVSFSGNMVIKKYIASFLLLSARTIRSLRIAKSSRNAFSASLQLGVGASATACASEAVRISLHITWMASTAFCLRIMAAAPLLMARTDRWNRCTAGTGTGPCRLGIGGSDEAAPTPAPEADPTSPSPVCAPGCIQVAVEPLHIALRASE